MWHPRKIVPHQSVVSIDLIPSQFLTTHNRITVPWFLLRCIALIIVRTSSSCIWNSSSEESYDELILQAFCHTPCGRRALFVGRMVRSRGGSEWGRWRKQRQCAGIGGGSADGSSEQKGKYPGGGASAWRWDLAAGVVMCASSWSNARERAQQIHRTRCRFGLHAGLSITHAS